MSTFNIPTAVEVLLLGKFITHVEVAPEEIVALERCEERGWLKSYKTQGGTWYANTTLAGMDAMARAAVVMAAQRTSEAQVSHEFRQSQLQLTAALRKRIGAAEEKNRKLEETVEAQRALLSGPIQKRAYEAQAQTG